MVATEGYPSVTSVRAGDTLDFHARSEPGPLAVQIVRKGQQDQVLHEDTASAQAYPIPADAYLAGCGWPPAYTMAVPEAWTSGLYVARLTMAASSTEIPFVVRPARGASPTSVLLEV